VTIEFSSSKDNDSPEYFFPPPPVRSLAIIGSKKRFPVRRIYCVGINYPRPQELLKRVPSLTNPPNDNLVIFDKHRDAITEDGINIPYPQGTSNLVHEVELVIAIRSLAIDASEDQALDHVFGYAVGNDLTRLDLMMLAMNAGGAVDVGKSFDYSAPCGSIYPVSCAGHVENARIWMTLDGEIKQEGNTGDMLKKPARLIAALSRLFHLQPGDLIYTGTPGLPGSVARGHTMVCGIEGLGTLSNKII